MKKFIPAALVSCTAMFAGITYIFYEEIMSRNKRIFPKVADAYYKIKAKEKAQMPETAKKPDETAVNEKWFNEQKLIHYTLKSDDGLTLCANFLPAENKSDVYVFCSHGYTSSGRGDFCRIAKFWHDKGYNVFMVDHRAHGESEGKYIGFGYYESKDSIKWINFMKKEFGEDIKVILHGISMGSVTVTMMSGDDNLPENVKLTVADCGFTTCEEEFRYVLKEMLHIPAFPLLNIEEMFNKKINGYSFKDPDPLACVKRARVPMLFIHGALDDFVPTRMSGVLYEACSSEEKELLIVEGAGHAESFRVNHKLYEEKAGSFADRILGEKS